MQVAKEAFEKETGKHLKSTNCIVTHLNGSPRFSLDYPRLDQRSLHIQVYFNAFFARDYDQNCQLGYIILLMNKNKLFHPFHWSFYKSKRSTRLHGIKIVFVDGFDMEYTLKHDMKQNLKKYFLFSMATDRQSLFDALTKATCTGEKRLMIGLRAVKYAYNSFEISNTALV